MKPTYKDFGLKSVGFINPLGNSIFPFRPTDRNNPTDAIFRLLSIGLSDQLGN
jgi:hypothetical protein